MSFGSKIPQKQMYEEMKDTPYITNLRDLSQKGYEGFNKNYNRVDVMDQDTERSINDVLNNYYKRAESDFDRQYRDTMNKFQNKNYGQFGTLNATPALYRTDMENLQQQRKLADLSYNKAKYYDELLNSELGRRYATLDMYNQMLEKGKTPYELDLKNWNIRNLNKDRAFENDEIDANAGGGLLGSLKGALAGAGTGFLYGGPWGALAGALGGGALGSIKQYNTGGQGAFSMGNIIDLGNLYGGAWQNQKGSNSSTGSGGAWGASGGTGGGILSTLGNIWSQNQYTPTTVGNVINSYIHPANNNSIYSLPDILDTYSTNVPSGVSSGTIQDAIDAVIQEYATQGALADAIQNAAPSAASWII